jgi:lipoprotein NlpI/transglutaminase-like putative cysteine protease
MIAESLDSDGGGTMNLRRQCVRAGAAAALIATCLAAAGQTTRSEARAQVAPGAAARPVARDGTATTIGIEPVPSWVVPAQEARSAQVDRAPMHYRLIDDQTLVDAVGATRYSHVVRVVDQPAGLEQAAQIEIVFDPTYQTLVFHHLDVVRDGKRTSRLDRRKIKLLQRETQLERRIYDGSVTASANIDDVRAGDEIDIAYSIKGTNPVFAGRFAAVEWMAPGRGPAALYQYRLLAPAARRIEVRAGSPEMRVESRVDRGMRETIVRRESVPMLHVDTGAPYSALLRHQVQMSEYADWADVARWGTALFDGGSGDMLERKAAEIRVGAPGDEARLLAALNFVQTEIRYFGTETGLNSHKPEAPQKVLEQRFGDCKDKVGLLIALLKRLDIPATPVLVSTGLRGSVEALLPSPLAFNHVIARVDLKGTTYWLDATRSGQSGQLATRQAGGFNHGLALEAATSGLADLPKQYDTVRAEVRDAFTVTDFARGAALESRVTYRGDLAEVVRSAIASRSMADVETQMTQPYARLYPKLVKTAPLRVESSESDDALTLVQHFDIADFWKFPDERLLVGEFAQWSIIEAVRPPNEPARRDAFAMQLPGIHRHVTSIDYPADITRTPATTRFDDGDSRVSLHTVVEFTARRVEAASELRIRVDEIPAADWPGYVAQIGKMAPHLGLSFNAPAVGLDKVEKARAELQELEQSMKSGKVKATTPVQVQALVKTRVLTMQIEQGRLAPRLRAQALAARGIQYDNLGRFKEAAQDFAQSLELAPDSVETQVAAAVNAMQTGDYGRALALAGPLLAKNPNDTEALRIRALSRYFTKEYALARSDLQEMLKDRTQVRRGYPLVWLSILDRKAGADPAQALAAFADDQLPVDWPRPVVDWARGKMTEDAMISAAKTDRGAAEHLCEAYYYIGERYFAEGDTKRAAAYFAKVVDQGVTEFVEDAAARIRLAELGR